MGLPNKSCCALYSSSFRDEKPACVFIYFIVESGPYDIAREWPIRRLDTRDMMFSLATRVHTPECRASAPEWCTCSRVLFLSCDDSFPWKECILPILSSCVMPTTAKLARSTFLVIFPYSHGWVNALRVTDNGRPVCL